MALGSKVDNGIGTEAIERLVHGSPIANVSALKMITRRVVKRPERIQIGRISELVDVENANADIIDKKTADSRTDKTRPACNDNSQTPPLAKPASQCLFLMQSPLVV